MSVKVQGPSGPGATKVDRIVVTRLNAVEVAKITGGLPLIQANSTVYGVAVPTEVPSFCRADGVTVRCHEVAVCGDTVVRHHLGNGWTVEQGPAR